ncbi:Spindle and centriole-associated protein 1 [Bulinus truncatus]|nr:Spindle and centriole-associated protein 1 [Bulinus truncatus]
MKRQMSFDSIIHRLAPNMSFHRVGYNHNKKWPARKKPAWDDTVNDLTILRATPEEVLQRKEAHKSKHHLSAKLEKLHKDRKSKLTGAEAHQLAIIKEVLYDQQQLQNVLAKSDSMMAVVKDLFGDDPKKFMGFPNVTSAPYYQDFNSSNSLVASVPDIYTRSEKLSDSVMDQSALNDIESSSESDSDDTEVGRPDPISYESKLNLQRFQEYLQEEERKTVHMNPVSLATLQNRNQSNGHTSEKAQQQSQDDFHSATHSQLLNAITVLLAQEQKEKDKANSSGDGFKTPPRDEQSPPLQCERTPPSAMNDTQKVKKTKKCTKTTAVENGNTTASMNDMRKVLEDLEKEIAAFELLTGRRRQVEIQKAETFSGYTISLVTAVSRLTKYLKETELRIRAEVMLREQLSQDVGQLKTIIDALATDMIVTQEEYGKLYSEHQRYKEATQNELLSLNSKVKELQKYIGGSESRSEPGVRNEERLHSHATQEDNLETNHSVSVISQPSHGDTTKLTGLPAAAVLLSPPARKTRVPVAHGATVSSERQCSLVDVQHSSADDSFDKSHDPPQLTQVPPVTNTISVPRPIPLVQTNVSVPIATRPSAKQAAEQFKGSSETGAPSKPLPPSDLADLVRLEDETEQQMHQLQELVMEEALNNPALHTLMRTQIAELNRQQTEAKRRLKDLLDHQKLQQRHIHEKFNPHLMGHDQIELVISI